MELSEITGTVFNIQSYCIHDGPGIRSTVFLKGCPLHCKWCQNPESLKRIPQLMFYGDRCTRCGLCAVKCPRNAVSWTVGERPKTRRELCTACGACTVCPARAREIAGSTRTAGDVLKELLLDRMFFEGSGGGITVSGGEPLFQPNFTAAILALAKQEGVHTAVESSCFAGREAVDQVYQYADLALCDMKVVDRERHIYETGVPNDMIKENICHIYRDLHVPVIIRTPVVPQHNGDRENIAATARFIVEQLDKTVPLHLLPYHKLGESKGQSLELPEAQYMLNIEPPAGEYMQELVELVQSEGLKTVHIGG